MKEKKGRGNSLQSTHARRLDQSVVSYSDRTKRPCHLQFDGEYLQGRGFDARRSSHSGPSRHAKESASTESSSRQHRQSRCAGGDVPWSGGKDHSMWLRIYHLWSCGHLPAQSSLSLLSCRVEGASRFRRPLAGAPNSDAACASCGVWAGACTTRIGKAKRNPS